MPYSADCYTNFVFGGLIYTSTGIEFGNYYTKKKTFLAVQASYREPGQLSRYGDSLRAGRSEDRFPVGACFSAPFQTGPGAHPGAKRPGRCVDHPHPSSAEVKERVGLYLYSPSGSSWSVLMRILPSICFIFSARILRNPHIIASSSDIFNRLPPLTSKR